MSSEYSTVIEVKSCNAPEPDDSAVEFAATNPFDNSITVFYKVNEPGQLQIQLVNINTGSSIELLPESDMEEGEYQLIKESGAISSGTYSIQAILNNKLFTKTIIKL